VQRHTKLDDVAKDITDNPVKQFLLLVEDFEHFGREMPEQWRRMPPNGGIPPNVWVGASIETQKEADERSKLLVKIRARRLFLFLKKNCPGVDLKPGLIAWRCSNCGRKDGYGRMKRPTECPSGNICASAKLDPQIHWVVSLNHLGYTTITTCSEFGVAAWDGQTLEIPE